MRPYDCKGDVSDRNARAWPVSMHGHDGSACASMSYNVKRKSCNTESWFWWSICSCQRGDLLSCSQTVRIHHSRNWWKFYICENPTICTELQLATIHLWLVPAWHFLSIFYPLRFYLFTPPPSPPHTILQHFSSCPAHHLSIWGPMWALVCTILVSWATQQRST